MTQNWNKPPKEVVGYLSLKIFKAHLDEILCKLL